MTTHTRAVTDVHLSGRDPAVGVQKLHICCLVWIPAALSGRVLDSVSPEDTPSFHINEGVAMQPCVPAADWRETGKQADSGGRDGIRGWILSHMLDFD